MRTTDRKRPTQEELQAAASKTLRDVIAPGLKVLFCGINPGLYTTAIGHHFGRPGNRFWPAMHMSGFTPRLFSPYEDEDLLKLGYGITNVVARTSARADQLSREELLAGAQILQSKVLSYEPRFLAILGIGAYRDAFQRKDAKIGRQEHHIGKTRVWILPNPSGLNAHVQASDLASMFAALKAEVDNHC